MTAMIEARGIGVRYGDREVLVGVDLRVDAGELVALVGPNGAGKSTLLHALSGDAVLATGVVELAGRPVRGARAIDLARRRSVLTQSNEISFPFTAREVVEMGRAPWRGRPEEDEDEEHIASAVEDAEVGSLLEQRVTELSGGERARVAFARVRAQACPLILLDEPTASLDIRHQERVLTRLAAHAEGGAAAVVVLHDLDLAAAYADRVVVLDAGRVRADGPPTTAFTSELLSAVYRHPLVVHSDGSAVRVSPVRTRPARARPISPRPIDPVGDRPADLPTDRLPKEHAAHA